MDPKTCIYIAGPMRGYPQWNFPAFHDAHRSLGLDDDAPGIIYFCPACQDEMTHGFSTEHMTGNEDLSELGFDLRVTLAKDLRWIAKHADVVVVLPGWENSKGACAEVALAHALGLIVMAYDDQADGFGDYEPIPFIPDYLAQRLAASTGQPCAICQDPDDHFGIPHAVATGDGLRRVDVIPVEDLHADFNTPEVTSEDLDRHFHEHADQVQNAAGETRVTSSTGGQKGTKLARFDLIPAGPLWQLAELYGKGAQKYEDRNWERGYAWSLSFAAACRHMWLFWMGEDLDAHNDDCTDDCVQHTGLPHPICAVFHMFALVQFLERNNQFDDRPIR